ncbi:MAG: penicillin-binding protein 2 [Hydrotalea sp.]|nr:penicillin-binding protein 2 [Hydrotalea sp.]
MLFAEEKVFDRRIALLQGGGLLMAGVLGARLVDLQIIKKNFYLKKSDNNRVRVIPIIPERGKILDRYGDILAGAVRNFRLDFLVSEVKDDAGAKMDHVEAFNKIANELKLTPQQRNDILSRIDLTKEFFPVTIKANISWDEMIKYRQDMPFFPGLLVSDNYQRYYPYKDNFTHIVGLVGNPTLDEATQDRQLKIDGLKNGKSGIEKWSDITLRGKPGTLSAEVDVHGTQVRDLGSVQSKSGRSVQSTLDSTIQNAMMAALKKNPVAAGVVLDAQTGDVLAMCSLPSFDPNIFAGGAVLPNDWQNINNNELSPLPNRVIQGAYPPGSTIKPLVALSLLHDNHDPEEKVMCKGSFKLGERSYGCWKAGGHGEMNMSDAIKYSCDVYFYTMGLRIGIEKIFRVFSDFGFGAPTGFVDKNERSGFIPSESWKMKTVNEPWYGGETVIHAVGQGYLLVTPIQLAVATAAIANGGHVLTPGIFPEKRPTRTLKYKPEHMEFIRNGMWRVVNEEHGTALGSNLQIPGFEMSGKTGTAQVRKLKEWEKQRGAAAQYGSAWALRDHGLFMAFAPYDNPRYAAAAVVEHGLGGALAAAPVIKAALVAAYQVEQKQKSAG